MTVSTSSDPGSIPTFLDRRPLIWTYTMLKTYRDICPHQAGRRYVVKDVPFVETPEIKHGNRVHSAMEHRVRSGAPLPTDMQQWEPLVCDFAERRAVTELKLGITKEGEACDYWGTNVWGRGKGDVVLVRGTTGYLGDYKTGNPREDAFELEIQALLLHARYPQLTTIVGQYFWLKENRLGPLHTLTDTRHTWKVVCDLVGRIEHDRGRGEFDKQSGPLCKWCPVKDCEHNRNEK